MGACLLSPLPGEQGAKDKLGDAGSSRAGSHSVPRDLLLRAGLSYGES